MTEEITSKAKPLEEIIAELYQGEVFGEAFVVELMKQFPGPVERYKLGMLLQLETETKARIRPVAAAYGVDLIENPDSRKSGMEMAASLPTDDWVELMAMLLGPSKESSDKYLEIAGSMPSELSEFAKMISEHEYAIHVFFANENSDRRDQSVDHFTDMLRNPLPRPSLNS